MKLMAFAIFKNLAHYVEDLMSNDKDIEQPLEVKEITRPVYSFDDRVIGEDEITIFRWIICGEDEYAYLHFRLHELMDKLDSKHPDYEDIESGLRSDTYIYAEREVFDNGDRRYFVRGRLDSVTPYLLRALRVVM